MANFEHAQEISALRSSLPRRSSNQLDNDVPLGEDSEEINLGDAIFAEEVYRFGEMLFELRHH
jgi:hypothetical protein